MLVLSRRHGEEIIIGGNIHVMVVSVQGDRVRLGISAPRSVSIDRQEIHERRKAMEVEVDESMTVVGATPECRGSRTL